MKHAGKAQMAALRLIFLALVTVVVLVVIGLLLWAFGYVLLGVAALLATLWGLFAVFTLYFFRDPEPNVPPDTRLVLAPAFAKVDAIDQVEETTFMGGRCQRISMFLSVMDVHVQRNPVSGRVALVKHTPGQYLNAMRTDSAQFNENVLIGIETTDPAGIKIGVRLIAGLIARRIVPWVELGESITRGERMSLIQFGSRADVYLPANARITVKLGDKVKGGETVLAELP